MDDLCSLKFDLLMKTEPNFYSYHNMTFSIDLWYGAFLHYVQVGKISVW